MFKTKILSKFNLKQFDEFYSASKEGLAKNLNWEWLLDGIPEDQHDEMIRQELIIYYKKYFGLQARLEGKFVYILYHEDHPEYELFYCAVEKKPNEQAAYYDITMVQKDINGSRSWLHEFYISGASIPMLKSMGLKRWYFKPKVNSDFLKDGLFNEVTSIRGNNVSKLLAPKDTVVSSAYGWDD